jgi:hypothetical protein
LAESRLTGLGFFYALGRLEYACQHRKLAPVTAYLTSPPAKGQNDWNPVHFTGNLRSESCKSGI